MVHLLNIDLGLDLTEFTQFLWVHNVPHRVTENESSQQLWVARQVNQDRIKALFEFWVNGGDLHSVEVVVNRSPARSVLSLDDAKRMPLTVALILLSALITLLIDFGSNTDWLVRFTFAEYPLGTGEHRFETLESTLADGQYWRLLSPIFMHFSVIHIVFNVLWIWMVGGAIERSQGSGHFLLLVLFSGAFSNLAQYWVTGPLFGGLSGVVFAVLAYTWLWDKLSSRPLFGLPSALFGLMLFWLALGYSGALEMVGLGSIANTAHLAGLIAGLFFAIISRLWRSEGS